MPKVKQQIKPITIKKRETEISYSDKIKPLELKLDDTTKLVFSVVENSLGETNIDIRTFVATEKYKGMTKKGINFPLERLEEFKKLVNQLSSKGKKLK